MKCICDWLIFQLLLCQVAGQFLTGHREFRNWIPPYVVRDVMHENFMVSYWLNRCSRYDVRSLQAAAVFVRHNIIPSCEALSPPVHIVWTVMNVWRIRGKIVKLFCAFVYDSCAQWYAHTWAVITGEYWFRFRFVHLFRFSILCVFFLV